MTNRAGDDRLGPILSAMGGVVVMRRGGWLDLVRDGTVCLRTDIMGRFTHLRIAKRAISLTVPAGSGDVAVPGWPAHETGASLDGAPIAVSAHDGGARISLPAGSGPRRMSLARGRAP